MNDRLRTMRFTPGLRSSNFVPQLVRTPGSRRWTTKHVPISQAPERVNVEDERRRYTTDVETALDAEEYRKIQEQRQREKRREEREREQREIGRQIEKAEKQQKERERERRQEEREREKTRKMRERERVEKEKERNELMGRYRSEKYKELQALERDIQLRQRNASEILRGYHTEPAMRDYARETEQIKKYEEQRRREIEEKYNGSEESLRKFQKKEREIAHTEYLISSRRRGGKITRKTRRRGRYGGKRT